MHACTLSSTYFSRFGDFCAHDYDDNDNDYALLTHINEIPPVPPFGIYWRILNLATSLGVGNLTSGICPSICIVNYRDLTHEVAPAMGDLIAPYIKSPYIP